MPRNNYQESVSNYNTDRSDQPDQPAQPNKSYKNKKYVIAFGTVVVGGICSFLAARYKVCQPNQVMVRTGLGIKDMIIGKRGVVWPLQKCMTIDMTPINCSFELHHISKDKLPFNLPVIFTVGPRDPHKNDELFKNFATKMSGSTDTYIHSIVKSVIHGESRVFSSNMNIEEMFSDRLKFKQMVTDKIQVDLDKFGIEIFNANIEEMKDMPGDNYFEYRKQRAIQSANNEARIDVSEAKKIGDIGETERQNEAKQKISIISAETTKIQNEQARIVAESDTKLIVAKAEFDKQNKIACTESEMAAIIRKTELERELEIKRIQKQIESQRATDLTKAQVEAEAKVKEAEGDAEKIRKIADGELYRAQKIAEGVLITKQKEAEGLRAIFAAQADGINQLMTSTKHNSQFLQFYLSMNSGLFEKLAAFNAQAIQGLQPKVNVWNTGSKNDDPFGSIRNIVSAVPPLLDVLKQQTGISLGHSSDNSEIVSMFNQVKNENKSC